ncbi:VWA domain-containing protein [Candidatus Woesearchaeota archaeon]|nr:VWA domain-containing protein [Candidatus Woesearchaeota archaeon]
MKGSSYDVEVEEIEEIDEVNGSVSKQDIEDKLLKSVLQNDKKSIEEGKLISESFNQGISAFNPDIMFENLTKNYSMAKKIYGQTLIKLISGYNSSYVERNINIPEFRRELKKKIQEKVEEMRDEKLLKRDFSVSDQGLKLASLILYTEELDNLIPKGVFGEKIHKERAHYGERGESRRYKKGDRYKDISIRESLKLALRRGRQKIGVDELKTSQRQSKGQHHIIYALDASGSMKGKKIEVCKKAGIALAYKAITAKDKVGLIVFGSDVKEEVRPTHDFSLLLREITRIKASKQTDFKAMLHKTMDLFEKGDYSKHLIVLTDAMPTVGKDPQKESIREISRIRNLGITVSLIGINLDKEARQFAERLVEIGEGRLYLVKELEELDKIVLEDYYAIA